MKNLLKALFKSRRVAVTGVFVGRQRTRDISFLAQAPSGFIGRISRDVPSPTILPGLNDATNPIQAFGSAVIDTATNTTRGVIAGDTALTAISGIAIQPYPFQQQATGYFGAVVPGSAAAVPAGEVDILRAGFATVYCNTAQVAAANKLSPVYVWVAASAGTHIQGGFETANTAGSTILIGAAGNGKIFFNGPGDATTGAIELAYNI